VDVIKIVRRGSYWTKDMDIWPLEYVGKLLCCVCVSPVYRCGESPEKIAAMLHLNAAQKALDEAKAEVEKFK
jgi:hypothetical protein